MLVRGGACGHGGSDADLRKISSGTVLPSVNIGSPDTNPGSLFAGGVSFGSGAGSSPRTMGLSLAELDLAAAFAFDVVPEGCFDEAACEPITFPVGMRGIPDFGRVMNCHDLLRGGAFELVP